MADNIQLKVMKCPSCGGELKAANGTDAIVCVWCCNTIVPVQEAPAVEPQNMAGNGTLKIEGMRTPSSALAFLEQFFEGYDWEAFAYAQSLSVGEIDRMVNSMKLSSADDKNTWLLSFKAICVPYVQKVNSCQRILDSVIAEYKKDNLDAYSRFDAYKRIAAMLCSRKADVVAQLEKNYAYAEKYGASAEELEALKAELGALENLDAVAEYSDIKQIPEIKAFIAEENTKIVEALAAKGINAEQEYARAKNLLTQRNYVEALTVLRSLNGYANSSDLIAKIDKYFLISDVLEMEGKLYYFRPSKSGEELNLHPTANGQILDKPVIKNIKQVITNYAGILYYLDGSGKLKKYTASSNLEEKLYKKRLDSKEIYVRGYRAFLLTNDSEDSTAPRDLIALDLVTGGIQTVLEKIQSIVSFVGNKLVYTTWTNGGSVTNVINFGTRKTVCLGSQALTVEGFLQNNVVFTQVAPNSYNKNLFVQSLDSQEPAKLIEKNIYRFCDIISGKLFYYVGNSRNATLISINADGTGRKEWPMYISQVLFAQGGWLYFIRRAGYNSVLCKSRIDGSGFCVIASDIEKFVELKNGYLYYINGSSDLVKVRMDGSNFQKLCNDVETVLSVKENKIIFVSVDDRITTGTAPFTTTRVVKSIYAVDFTGSGKIKLAYNVGNAKEYDDHTVYYVTAEEDAVTSDGKDATRQLLYKLDVESNNTQFLLTIDKLQQKSGCYVATCVYGSYDCPQVWTLRRYRDEVLATTWYGRAFIHTYYAISPTLVKWFGDTKWFKKLWQGKLDRMVSSLREQGIENTPYEDKRW